MSNNTIDLDALEKEGRPEPLVISIRGKRFTTADPLLLPWETYQSTDWFNTEAVLAAVLSPDDHKAILELKLTQHAMNILLQRFEAHYFPDASPGESSASPPS